MFPCLYIATVPHLHHIVVMINCRRHFNPKQQRPDPLQNASRLRLLPFVKRLQIRAIDRSHEGLYPKLFNHHTLRQISQLSNVQELEIDDLDTHNLMSRIRDTSYRRSDLSPLVTLKGPVGRSYSSLDCSVFKLEEPAEDPALISLFTPPLRERLTMMSFKRVRLLKDVVYLFGRSNFIIWTFSTWVGCNSWWTLVWKRWKHCAFIRQILVASNFLSESLVISG